MPFFSQEHQDDNYLERRLKEIENQHDMIDIQKHEVSVALGVSLDQLAEYSKNRDNFTDEQWERLENMRKSNEERLKKEMENRSNPKKTEARRRSLNIGQNWLFVR